ncbi:hypothetical protein [Nocardioides sp.]|uniref:hypothetical protein n=1 Tax=Nocardioides sp. TaxID=35761 RepID=UPI002B27814B|nr:hypothetical protein [Nocardioides sp.]
MTTHCSRPRVRARVRVRTLAAAAVSLLVLSGCGGSDSDVAADPVGTPSAEVENDTDTGTSEPAGIDHPTGAEDVLLRIETGGGYAPVEYTFTRQPALLLTGDGRLFVPPADLDSSRLIPMNVAQLDETQVQELLAMADDAGLLAPPPDYSPDADGPQVADAPTTTVSVTSSDGTWRHEAYALGFNDQSDARLVLSGFVDAALEAVTDIETVPFEAAEVALFVQETDFDEEVIDWPVDDVVLADVNGCAAVPADGVVEALSATGPVVSFAQGSALYSVAGAEVLPGIAPCGA